MTMSTPAAASSSSSEKPPIYLDYNATTPVLPEVAQAMMPYLGGFFGNPSSSHYYGAQTKKAVELARQQVATMLNCFKDEVVFTSGGSESNNYAIKGAVEQATAIRGGKPHIITSVIEHPSVIEVCKYLEKNGKCDVSYVSVDAESVLNVEEFKKALLPSTCLVTVMHSNNETGSLQPIKEIAKLAHEYNKNILVHTDASQSIGKVPVDVADLGVDLLTVCSHKFYGPKGIGALFMKRGVKLSKQIHGATHEQDLRAGTENVLEIVGVGKACDLVTKDLYSRMKHFSALRDKLHNGLVSALGEKNVKLNGPKELRLTNTLNVSFPKIEANTLLSAIGNEVAASAGAACHSAEDITISAVLSAMGVPVDVAMGTIRFSTGLLLSEADVDTAIQVIVNAIRKLRPVEEEEEYGDEESEELTAANGSNISLTSTTRGLGCGCKIGPKTLENVLRGLPPQPYDPNVLVGNETADDAAVYKLSESIAVVHTVDFFTPIVDDAKDFGAIACANALSDIYAMGARATTALNIVAFPAKRLPLEVLHQILLGAQEKANEAGVSILGGHTIDDTEPKFGMSVTGTVHPDKIWKNSTAQAGDVLILTKPLGVGILTTAMKRKLVSEAVVQKTVKIMSTLNKYAADILLSKNYTVHACTDVTGFGFLGHLKEVSLGSKLNIAVYAKNVPIAEGAEDFLQMGILPGGTKNNFNYVKEYVRYDEGITQNVQYLLSDAQTSGGLLVSVPASEAQQILQDFKAAGIDKIIAPTIVGRVLSHEESKQELPEISPSAGIILVKNSEYC